ncbi:GTP:AMP phosphotransferase AK3, mitochondrial [Smittium mucronatum]|uniref:GTP:AMP phosphotransferase, mitochondrial n=1 Tax=Smittium mucronatum TaxID=133383 RepID=A0A1R0H0Z9_9FUNG|nr:GTP:AMP phosphotransferase AK3, mitochondrial [Smittium mucronatum]
MSQISQVLAKTVTGVPVRAMILGAPGSGKGTQTKKIKSHFDVLAISSGDLLRKHIQGRTQVGLLAKSYVENGELVPDNVIVKLIGLELKRVQNKNWFLDGFPRTADQALVLDDMLDRLSCPLNLVINLDVPEEVILSRILERYVHIPSGRIYNLTYNPPRNPGVDDLTNEPLVHRPDDNPDSLKIRLQRYRSATMPLLDYYNKKGLLKVFSGNSSDAIYPQIHSMLLETFI